MATVIVNEVGAMDGLPTVVLSGFVEPSGAVPIPILSATSSVGTGIGLLGSFQDPGGGVFGTVTKAYINVGSAIPDFEITGLSFNLTSTYWAAFKAIGNMATFVGDLLAGDDTIIGGFAEDHLNGFGGNDILIGGVRADRLDGGSGVNTASYSTAPAGLFAGIADAGFNSGDAAGDTYFSINNLIGSQFNDTLYGDGSVNRLSGGVGNDLLVGKGGADVLDGGVGIDTAGYDASFTTTLRADLLYRTTNTNAAAGDVYISIENLAGSSFNDVLAGDNLANVISGSEYPKLASGNDQLFGRGGNDTLSGYDGNDRLEGNAGIDILFGGAGSDTFVLNATPNAATNRDIVVDYVHGADHLQLENAVFTKLGSQAGIHALNPAYFHLGTAAADANDYLVYDRTSGILYYDANANAAGGAIAIAAFSNHTVLSAGDFAVI